MVFKPGWEGGPGRPPGKNKVREILEKQDIDPVIELLKIAMNPKTPDKMRTDIFQDLMAYIHPRLKQVALTDVEGHTLNLPQAIHVVMPSSAVSIKNNESE